MVHFCKEKGALCKQSWMQRRAIVAAVFMLCVTSFSVHAFSRSAVIAARPLAAHMSSFRRMNRVRSTMRRAAPALFAADNAAKPKLEMMLYPHPALRAENKPVAQEEFTNELGLLCGQLLDMMYKEGGIGLAAPQAGVNKRIMVWNHTGLKERWYHEQIMINPKITARSQEMTTSAEMCLSFPGVEGSVARHKWIEVEWQNLDRTLDKRRLKNIGAIVFQHEYDHLDGVLFIDKMIPEDKANQANIDALSNLVAHHGPGAAP